MTGTSDLQELRDWRGKYKCFSNFFSHTFRVTLLNGREAPDVETPFQALKTKDKSQQEWVFESSSPREAKSRGRQVPMRDSWEKGVREQVMLSLLRDKFSDPTLRDILLSTGNRVLVEGNRHHDQYWGDCGCPRHRDTKGLNRLGVLLMKVRGDLRATLHATEIVELEQPGSQFLGLF